MPQGFNVGDKPSIPQPVDLKDTDPERQKLYGKLTEMTEAFVEYDIKITGQCAPAKPKNAKRTEGKERSDVFYVK